MISREEHNSLEGYLSHRFFSRNYNHSHFPANLGNHNDLDSSVDCPLKPHSVFHGNNIKPELNIGYFIDLKKPKKDIKWKSQQQ